MGRPEILRVGITVRVGMISKGFGLGLGLAR